MKLVYLISFLSIIIFSSSSCNKIERECVCETEGIYEYVDSLNREDSVITTTTVHDIETTKRLLETECEGYNNKTGFTLRGYYDYTSETTCELK